MNVKIDDEMVKRALDAAWGRRWQTCRKVETATPRHDMSRALEAALNPKPEEPGVTEEMILAAENAVFLKDFQGFRREYYGGIYRAMYRARPKECESTHTLKLREGWSLELPIKPGHIATRDYAGVERRSRRERRMWTSTDAVCTRPNCGKTFPCPKRRKDDP